MVKEAIIIEHPSEGTLKVLEQLKEYKSKVLEQMRSQRDLTIDISTQ